MNRYRIHEPRPVIPEELWKDMSIGSCWVMNAKGFEKNLEYIRPNISKLKGERNNGIILLIPYFRVIAPPIPASELKPIEHQKPINDMVYLCSSHDSRGLDIQVHIFSSDLQYYDHE